MEATFIIAREDLQVDPVTIVAEGLLIGRLPICELLLNHPSVSRLHAGISYADGNYYLRNLRPGNPIMVNGEKLEEYEALADGDVVGIGPFALNIGFAQGLLVLKVSLQIAASPADAIARRDVSASVPMVTIRRTPATRARPSMASRSASNSGTCRCAWVSKSSSATLTRPHGSGRGR